MIVAVILTAAVTAVLVGPAAFLGGASWALRGEIRRTIAPSLRDDDGR